MMGDVSMEDLSKLDENVTLATTENIFVEGEKNILEDERNIEMSNILELGEWKIPADIVEITEEGDQKKDQKEKQDKKEIAESLYDDDGAASDLEFDLGDDRESSIELDESMWVWHIEMYPVSSEDSNIENFVNMISAAAQCHIVSHATKDGKTKGEAHFYTNDDIEAKTVMRNLCCRRFSSIRPFVYIRHQYGDVLESARLRLDLPESAKIRWDPPRGQKGTPSACIAKVSNVPVNTSQELLSTVFARAFRVKMMSDENEAEEARKAKEAGELCKNNSADETVNDEDGDKSVGEEEELVGEFNGKVYVNCSTRTGLKGLLVGYRVAVINDTLIVIAPLEEESVDIVTHRKELREKRRHEAVHGKVWTDVTEADHVSYKEDTVVSDQNEYGYSKWGRGGYGGRQDSSYGGDFSSGRPRFNDRQDRYGGFNPGRGGGRGGTWGGRPRDCDRSHDFPSLLDFSPNRHDFPSRGGRRGGYGSSEGRWNSGGSWGGYPKGGKPRGRKY